MIKRAILQALGAAGYELRRISRPPVVEADSPPNPAAAAAIAAGCDKIHYGCGPRLLNDGWVNVDLAAAASAPGAHYVQVDITGRHPFPDDVFDYAYAEDVIEHLDQEPSLRFLVEVRRVLKPGGVLRLSFPAFENVLA